VLHFVLELVCAQQEGILKDTFEHSRILRAQNGQQYLHAGSCMDGIRHAAKVLRLRERTLIEMTAGIPGTGLGGFFYLLCALLMPFHELISLCAKRDKKKPRWNMVLRQTGSALAVLLGIWATGWLLGHLMFKTVIQNGMTHGAIKIPNFIRISTVFFALSNLLALIVGVLLLSIPLKPRKRR